MRRFKDQPIKIKLLLLLATTSLTAMSLACGGFWAYEANAYRGILLKESMAIASMIGQNSTAAILFSDEQAASEMLSGLRSEPRIVHACIYQAKGETLARYAVSSDQQPCPEAQHRATSVFSLRYLSIHLPITLNREDIGEVFLEVSLHDMYARARSMALTMLALLAIASSVSLLLSTRLQRIISGPILHLTDVAGKVTTQGDYSIRALGDTRDELGMLVTQFNHMMEEINKRDEELLHHRDMLELRVAERTRALETEIAERKMIERDLNAARIAAEASNEAKSEFLANMSHELRTPLTAIIGYSEMLEEDAAAQGDAQVASDLHRIHSAGRHLLLLVNDILDLAKIEAGKAKANLEWVPVSSVLRQVSETVHPLASKKNNVFELNCSNETRMLRTDLTKLSQILINLLSNACKFTENGTVSLIVSEAKDSEGEKLLWAIKDTGIGIEQNDLAKLFKPFSQVDTTATRKFGGTGLGLDISQRLSRLLGGSITVHSKVGEGSTFILKLPVDSSIGHREEKAAPVLMQGADGQRDSGMAV